MKALKNMYLHPIDIRLQWKGFMNVFCGCPRGEKEEDQDFGQSPPLVHEGGQGRVSQS